MYNVGDTVYRTGGAYQHIPAKVVANHSVRKYDKNGTMQTITLTEVHYDGDRYSYMYPDEFLRERAQ